MKGRMTYKTLKTKAEIMIVDYLKRSYVIFKMNQGIKELYKKMMKIQQSLKSVIYRKEYVKKTFGSKIYDKIFMNYMDYKMKNRVKALTDAQM